MKCPIFNSNILVAEVGPWGVAGVLLCLALALPVGFTEKIQVLNCVVVQRMVML